MTPTPLSVDTPPDLPVHELIRHPASPAAPEMVIKAGVQIPTPAANETGPGFLSLRFVLQGQMDQLRIPPKAAGEARDGLWQHTCAELFVRTRDCGAYQELNFSPSGQWAAYRFSSERQRDTQAEARHPATAPRIEVQACGDRIAIHILLPLQNLSLDHAAETLWLGLNMVTEQTDGTLAYWALRHPRPERPDFHLPDGCALPLRWPAPVAP